MEVILDCDQYCFIIYTNMWMRFQAGDDVCLVLFVSYLAIQLLEFDQKLHENLTKNSHVFQICWMVWVNIFFALTSLWFPVVWHLRSCSNGGKVKNDIFAILIYEFNIYLFFKMRGRWLLEKGASWKEYGIYDFGRHAHWNVPQINQC